MNIQKYKFAFLIWTIIIIVGLSIPGQSLPKSSIIGIDKIVHVSMFFVWMVLALHSFRWTTKRTIFRIFIIGCIFAVTSELYQQSFIPNRLADVWDVAADVLGLVLAIGLWDIRARR